MCEPAGLDLQMANTIIALDQATKVTGWSVWCDGVLTEYGHVSFDDADPFVRNNRLTHWLANLLENRDPADLVVIEDIQMQVNNVVTFQRLAQLQGAIIDMLIDWRIDLRILGSYYSIQVTFQLIQVNLCIFLMVLSQWIKR